MRRLIGIAYTALVVLAISVFFHATATAVDAQYSTPNNKFGIHLISPTDEEIRDACRTLANASGGAGGKLTLTLVKDDIDLDTLQRYHNIAREENCIFIHPIKNTFGDPYWNELDDSTISFFENLFEDLKPSSKHLFVILGNENNRGDESGGECNPESYARFARKAAERLKARIPNIEIGLTGLDPYAPSGGFYCSRDEFIRRMFGEDPTLVQELIDFQAVHEYPDADMTGALRSHWQSERNLMRSLGVTKELPVFITEISWRRHRGLTDFGAAQRLASALSRLNSEDSVWAITPFVYKFCGHPFDQFSFVTCDGNQPYEVFNALADFPKVEGEPEHIHLGRSQTALAQEVIENTDYIFELELTNQGTDIWQGIGGDYKVELFGPDVQSSFSSFHKIRPDKNMHTLFRFNPGDLSGCPKFQTALTKNGRVLLQLFEWQPCVVPPPTMALNISTFPGNEFNGIGEVQIFDEHESLVFRQQAEVVDGLADIGPVEGVHFEDEYRIVWLSAGNLPVQITEARFHKGNNVLSTPMLLPLDANEDGELTLGDVMSGFSNQGF